MSIILDLFMSKEASRTVFAKNLRRMRKEMGMSQEKLAELCDLHRTYIGMIERDEQNVSLDIVDKIASSLGVEPYILLQEPIPVKSNITY